MNPGGVQRSRAAPAERTVLRAARLLVPLADPHAAAELIDSQLCTAEPGSAQILRTAKAYQLAMAGLPGKALAVHARIDPGGLGPISTVYYHVAAALAHCDIGDVDRAVESARHSAAHRDRSAAVAHRSARAFEFAVTAAVFAGQFDRARALAECARQRWSASPGPAAPAARALSAVVDLPAGDVEAAAGTLADALADLRRFGDAGGLTYRFAILDTEAVARCGDRAGAIRAEAEMERRAHPACAYARPDEFLSRAWVSFVCGRRGRARELSLAAAALARERGQLAREIVALRTATAFGADGLTRRLGALCSRTRGPAAGSARRG